MKSCHARARAAARRTAIAAPALAVLLAAACISVETPYDPGPVEAFTHLDFPAKLVLVPWGTYHGVNLVIERERAPDPIPRVIPRLVDGVEIYRFGDDVEVAYINGAFEAGGQSFRARSGSTLFVFEPRRDGWSFLFHGVTIGVRRAGAWTPALSWSAVYEGEEPGAAETPGVGDGDGDGDDAAAAADRPGDPDQGRRVGPRAPGAPPQPVEPAQRTRSTRLLAYEEILVSSGGLLPTRIVHRAGRPVFEVNGRAILVEPGSVLQID